MEIENLINNLNRAADDWEEKHPVTYTGNLRVQDALRDAASALSTLQEENEKLRAELEQVKRLYESEKEDFIDFAYSGVPNLAPYCLNRHPDCVDERGWCVPVKCHGFSRDKDE